MDEKEAILKTLEKLDNLIEIAQEIEQYGGSRKGLSYLTRQSIYAGKLCETVKIIDQAETIAENHPRSIIARKAALEARQAEQELAELERIINEPIEKYDGAFLGYEIQLPKRKYVRKEKYMKCWTDHHHPMYLFTEPE